MLVKEADTIKKKTEQITNVEMFYIPLSFAVHPV